MKILLDINKKVIDTTENGDFVITKTEAYKVNGNVRALTYGGYNDSNCSVIVKEVTEKINNKIYDEVNDKFVIDIHDPNTTQLDIDLLNAPEYVRLRAKEYPPIQEMIVALWEDVVEGRPQEKARIQALRVEIKNKYPKN